MAQQETCQAFLKIWADFPAPFRHNNKDSTAEILEDGSEQRQICTIPQLSKVELLGVPQGGDKFVALIAPAK